MEMKDSQFLEWVKHRLIYVYKEDQDVDFVKRLEAVIKNVKEREDRYVPLRVKGRKLWK